MTWMLRKQLQSSGLITGADDDSAAGQHSHAATISQPEMARLLASQDSKLELIATELEAVMDWVHRREVFVQLSSQTYSSRCSPCDVRHEISKVHFGEGMAIHFHCDEVLLMDKNVLNVVIEEGLSNASKYRAPGSVIEVNVSMELEPATDGMPSLGDDHDCIDLSKNEGQGTHGSKARRGPQQILILEIRNQNPPHGQPLSTEDCRRVFEPGYKAHAMSAHSDGIGLDSVAQACAAAGGRAYLSTSTEEDRTYTTFHAHLLAQQLADLSENSSKETLPFSESTSIDRLRTQSQRDPIAATGQPLAAASSIDGHCDGTSENLSRHTTRRRRRGCTQERGPLVCIAVDDDPFLRVAHNMFFESVLGANMAQSGAMGVTEAELLAFCDVAMGRKAHFGHSAHVADLLFIDHDLGPDATMMGTELARRVDADGFPGLICIVTAASKNEHEQILSLPYVHLLVEKGFRPAELAERIWSSLAEL
mmetsp:Transcript_46448/g.121920  ORF Transcript_46448/g.121920 Transcript_46448/m.121920 type:complete len:479 (+) Transcript_46448:1590-3026(+)